MTAGAEPGVAHLAGTCVEYNSEEGPILRQRCSWCGTTLVDVHLARVAASSPPPPGEDVTYPTWEVGGFVNRDGGLTHSVEWSPGEPVPDNACLRMPLEVTR